MHVSFDNTKDQINAPKVKESTYNNIEPSTLPCMVSIILTVHIQMFITIACSMAFSTLERESFGKYVAIANAPLHFNALATDFKFTYHIPSYTVAIATYVPKAGSHRSSKACSYMC